MENIYLKKLKENEFKYSKDYHGCGTTYYGKQGWTRHHDVINTLTLTDDYFIDDENKKYVKCTFKCFSEFREYWDSGTSRAPSRKFVKRVDIWYNEEWLNSEKGEKFLNYIFNGCFKKEICNEKEFNEIMSYLDSTYKPSESPEQKEMIEQYKLYKSVLESIPESELSSSAALLAGQIVLNIASEYFRTYGKNIPE